MTTDIVIAGGGMVGASLACALGQAGLRVTIVEPRAVPGDNGVDPRVVAISAASQSLLQAIGVWPLIDTAALSPYEQMQVRDATGTGSIGFAAVDIGVANLGHIVANHALQQACETRLRELPSVDWQRPSAVTAFVSETEAVRVQTDRGELSARLLVAADGARSPVRDMAGIVLDRHSYHQQALVCAITTERPHGRVARQCFLPGGPLALLPLLDEHRCSIVWTCSDNGAETLQQLDDAAFNQRLQQAFGDELGELGVHGARYRYPLQRAHADRYVQPRLALIGDAAHVIHPLAGQGVNLGLLDVGVLTGLILEAVERQRDPGRLAVLRRYERWRHGDNTLALYAMDVFNQLFGGAQPALRWLRNRGLSLTDKLTPLKRRMIRRAMGLDGDLPALCRARY